MSPGRIPGEGQCLPFIRSDRWPEDVPIAPGTLVLAHVQRIGPLQYFSWSSLARRGGFWVFFPVLPGGRLSISGGEAVDIGSLRVVPLGVGVQFVVGQLPKFGG